MSDSNAGKQLVEQAMDRVWHHQDFDLVADDYVDHNLPPMLPRGKEGLQALVAFGRAAFPDVRVTVADSLAEDDRVMVRVVNRGTNTGSFMGQPPTGKTAEWETYAIFRVSEGKLVERWGAIDAMSLFPQLGFQVTATADPEG